MRDNTYYTYMYVINIFNVFAKLFVLNLNIITQYST